MMRISVINHTNGAVKDTELQEVIRAVNQQVEHDFRPYWHKEGLLRLDGHAHSSDSDRQHIDLRGDAIIYIWDEVDPEGALGFHALNNKGIPYGMVFKQMSDELGEHWSVTFSHELLELLMDPEANMLVAGPHPSGEDRMVFHWCEVCDAVQTQHYDINGVAVSNFVLPLYYTQGDEFDGRNDFLRYNSRHQNTLTSFGVAEGGYVGYYDPLSRKHETYFMRKDQNAQHRMAIKSLGKLARRSVRYQQIGQDKTMLDANLVSIPTARRGFKVEGPWNIGEPVHEVMTLMALKGAIETIGNARGSLLAQVDENRLPSWSSTSAHNLYTNRLDRSVQQFIRGVIWPDDPEGLFFDEAIWMEDFSSGFLWGRAFKKNPEKTKNLTARSHFGNLQFFHGMASKNRLTADKTRKKILLWAETLIEIASAQLSLKTKVRQHSLLKKLFPATKHKNWTIHQLFGSGSTQPATLHIQQRALGALLHLIQDACAAGHVSRERDTFLIRQFLTYGSQDHDQHSEQDVWGRGANLAEQVQNTQGAAQAIQWCSRVIAMIDQGRDTGTVVDYLELNIFKLADETVISGPGDNFS